MYIFNTAFNKSLHWNYKLSWLTLSVKNWNVVGGWHVFAQNTDQKWRTTPRSDTFSREKFRFKAKSESAFLKHEHKNPLFTHIKTADFWPLRGTRTHQLLHNTLNQFPERVIRMLLIEMVDELGNHLRISFAFEFVALLLQENLHLPVVGDDTVVHHHETVRSVGALGMRIHRTGYSMSGPTGVGDTTVDVCARLNIQLVAFCNNFLCQTPTNWKFVRVYLLWLISSSNWATFPVFLITAMSLLSGESTATPWKNWTGILSLLAYMPKRYFSPAESYPRYSNRLSPFTKISKISDLFFGVQ